MGEEAPRISAIDFDWTYETDYAGTVCENGEAVEVTDAGADGIESPAAEWATTVNQCICDASSERSGTSHERSRVREHTTEQPLEPL